VGLERGPLSLANIPEQVLERKSSGSGLENRDYGRGDPSPRGTLYPQKLALTSQTSGGRSVGIVRSRTRATEFYFGSSWQFLFHRLSHTHHHLSSRPGTISQAAVAVPSGLNQTHEIELMGTSPILFQYSHQSGNVQFVLALQQMLCCAAGVY
jgi:hypothetical protein